VRDLELIKNQVKSDIKTLRISKLLPNSKWLKLQLN